MTQWRVLVSDVGTPDEFVAELPHINLTCTDTLNESGFASTTIPLSSDAPITMANFGPGQSCLWLEREGALLWGGIVWAANPDVSSNTLTVSAGGWHSYTRRRTIRQTLAYAATDQLDIARDLIDKMEAVSGSLGIIGTAETATSGRTRDRTYPYWERKNYGAALDQLAAVNDGFDFRYVTAYTSGVPGVEFTTTYPALGRLTNTVLELGAQVETIAGLVDASQMVTEVDALGEGEGPARLIRTATDSTRHATFPLLQAAEVFSDVSKASTLQDHAGRRLARGGRTEQWTVRLSETAPTLGGVDVGDVVTVRASDGWLDVSGRYRVTQRTVNVGESGGEMVDLTVASWAVFGDA